MNETPFFPPQMNCEPPLTEAEQKLRSEILDFAKWMRTYVVNVAKRLGERFQNEDELHESGYFILAGLTSYFEGVGQHILGTAGTWNPKKRRRISTNEEYKTTWKEIFGGHSSYDDDAQRFKDCIRNGLAHDGTVRNRVELSRYFKTAIGPICNGCRLVGFEINPYYVAIAVENHFNLYIAKLLNRNAEYDDLRAKFSNRRQEIAHDYEDAPDYTPSEKTTTDPNRPKRDSNAQ